MNVSWKETSLRHGSLWDEDFPFVSGCSLCFGCFVCFGVRGQGPSSGQSSVDEEKTVCETSRWSRGFASQILSFWRTEWNGSSVLSKPFGNQIWLNNSAVVWFLFTTLRTWNERSHSVLYARSWNLNLGSCRCHGNFYRKCYVDLNHQFSFSCGSTRLKAKNKCLRNTCSVETIPWLNVSFLPVSVGLLFSSRAHTPELEIKNCLHNQFILSQSRWKCVTYGLPEISWALLEACVTCRAVSGDMGLSCSYLRGPSHQSTTRAFNLGA